MGSVILSCPTLKKEFQHALAVYQCSTPVYYLPQELHNNPSKLHEYLQTTIDSFDNIDKIMICVSGCGGGTIGLQATSARLVVPKTRDCIDILLSGDILEEIYRPEKGIFFTESWMNFSKNSSLDLNKQIEQKGYQAAAEYMRRLFKGFEHFYIIDTGVYDIKEVQFYIEPLVEILNGTITLLKGDYQILHKMVLEKFDDDFIIVTKGSMVNKTDFDKKFL